MGIRRTLAGALVAATTVGLLGLSPAAMAHDTGIRFDGKIVVAGGECTADSHWRLALKQRHHAIRLLFGARTGVPDELWRIRIWHDRHLRFAGRRITNDDGVFGVRLLNRNLRGPDVFHVRARNVETGEVCRGRTLI